MIKDLKETLSETKETIHEHVAVIGTQRAEIDSLRNLLDQHEIEVKYLLRICTVIIRVWRKEQ